MKPSLKTRLFKSHLSLWTVLTICLAGTFFLSSCSKVEEEDFAVEPKPQIEQKIVPSIAPPPVPEESAEKCLESICFNEVYSFDGRVYVLSGIGKRQYLWADIYTAAFYLPQGVRPDYENGVPQGPKLIVLEYQRTVEKQKVIDSIINNVTENPDADEIVLRPRFDHFTEGFEPPHNGSRYFFVYDPETGTQLIKDGKATVTIEGDDFADAFFGIWLHKNVTNQSLRNILLGKEKP